jgi:hypothetical protein
MCRYSSKIINLLFVILIGLIFTKEVQTQEGPVKYPGRGRRYVHQPITEHAGSLLRDIEDGKYRELYDYSRRGEEISNGSGNEDDRLMLRPHHHCYNPLTKLGKPWHEDDHEDYIVDPAENRPLSALEWAIGEEDCECWVSPNEFDWQDALYYFLEKGDKEEGYLRLGHVLHLLQDVSLPPHVTPGRVSLLRDERAMLGYPHGDWIPPQGGYEPYSWDCYELIIDATTIKEFDYSSNWKEVLEEFFNSLALEAQKRALRYRQVKRNKEGEIVGPRKDYLDIYNLEYDELVWDKKRNKAITAAEAYWELLSKLIPLAQSYTAGLMKYFYDFTHLEVEKTSPQDGEEDVPIHTTITITFDQPIDPESFILDETFFISPKTQGTFSLSQDKNAIIFDLEILQKNTT